MSKLETIINKYSVIAIVGPPKAGKTTLSGKFNDRKIIHADDWIDVPWKEQPISLMKYCQNYQKYLVEGCLVPRTLRKGLKVDAVILLKEPHIKLTPAQDNFSKGCMTVFQEWKSSNPQIPIFTDLD